MRRWLSCLLLSASACMHGPSLEVIRQHVAGASRFGRGLRACTSAEMERALPLARLRLAEGTGGPLVVQGWLRPSTGMCTQKACTPPPLTRGPICCNACSRELLLTGQPPTSKSLRLTGVADAPAVNDCSEGRVQAELAPVRVIATGELLTGAAPWVSPWDLRVSALCRMEGAGARSL